MNKNIHPIAAILIVVLCVSATSIWLYCAHQAKRFGGPAGLSVDPRGHLYIQVQNQLLEHDPSGAFVARHDLAALGVETLIGDTAFFSNGDLLLRLGTDTRSLGDNVRAFLRHTNTGDLKATAPDTGLYRCNLSAMRCRVFGDAPLDFGAAFGVVIDPLTDAVFVADSSRHVVRKLSAEGRQAAQPAAGFRFPNGLVLHGDVLLVADTNHHRVRAVRPQTERFGAEYASFDVVPPEAAARGRRWPSQFVRVGDSWWVNNMTSAMNYGRIDIFDAEWRHRREVVLPGKPDPIELIAFNGEVLISDWFGDRVHRVSEAGVSLGDFESAGLSEVLSESRERRDFFRLCGWLAIALAAGLTAIVVFKGTDWTGSAAAGAPPDGDSSGGGPVTLEPDPKSARELRVAALMTGVFAGLGLCSVPAFMYLGADGRMLAQLALCSIAFIGIFVLLYWMAKVNTSTAISLDEKSITLRDHRHGDVRSPLARARYSDHVVTAGGVAVFLGQGKMALYDRAAVLRELEARLHPSQRISSWAMQKKLIALRHPNGMLTMLIFLVAAIAGLLLALR